MARENPYKSPNATLERRQSVALSFTVFMTGLPFVIFGAQAVVACLYWFVDHRRRRRFAQPRG